MEHSDPRATLGTLFPADVLPTGRSLAPILRPNSEGTRAWAGLIRHSPAVLLYITHVHRTTEIEEVTGQSSAKWGIDETGANRVGIRMMGARYKPSVLSPDTKINVTSSGQQGIELPRARLVFEGDSSWQPFRVGKLKEADKPEGPENLPERRVSHLNRPESARTLFKFKSLEEVLSVLARIQYGVHGATTVESFDMKKFLENNFPEMIPFASWMQGS